MKALIHVKRLRLRHVLIRLPCLLSTLPLHTQFQAAVIPPSMTTNRLHPPLLRLACGSELRVIPYLNSPRCTSWETLGNRDPRSPCSLAGGFLHHPLAYISPFLKLA